MKRNLALSILWVPLAAVLAAAQADSVPPAKHGTAGQSTSALQAAAPGKIASAKPGQAANPAQAGEHPGGANSGGDLTAVLAKMNQAARTFKSAQGDFEVETYTELIKEKEQQQGHVYFRRNSKGVDAAFNIPGKAPKQVVYKDGKILIYEQKINQITEKNVTENKADVEAFLSLGFGARGDDLQRDYDVKLAGWETVNATRTARLDLVPKSEKMRHTYNKILLWVDPERDILLQQQFFEPSGDYRLVRYTNMKLNGNLSDDNFRLKTTGKPTTVRPQ
jgi:outer membrane lipoprotein-sorting protein